MTVTESPSSSERAVLTRRVLLLSRHAHEEYEHKGVAFDVFQTVSGSHRIRVGVMNAVTAAFIGGAVVVAALALLTGRSARNPRRPRRDPARIGRQEPPPARPDRRMTRSTTPPGDFYTSSTLFGVTGWYEAVRSGSAAARKPSSQVLQGTPGYGLAASSSGS